MTEDNFEEFLKKTAQGYNAPPARVPREEMWSAIQAKRAVGPRVVYGGGLATGDVRRKRFGARVWMAGAAAALVLVATGVGIGRWSAGSSPASTVATRAPVQPAQEPRVEASGVAPSADAQVVAANPASNDASSNSGRRGSGAARPTSRRESSGSNETRVAAGVPSSASSGSAYQLTTISHLSEAEALLTSFRARSTADQQMDAQLGTWARQLLSNTRLLLDSPVANDPQRRPLLEDLELVLVQIVQLSPGSTPQDRDMIEKTLRQDHVMTRLRTAIPAGSQRGS
jgi:hypothetical protein